MTMADELEKLHRLLQGGALTPAEYEAAKARVLGGAAGSSGPSLGDQPAAPVRRRQVDRGRVRRRRRGSPAWKPGSGG